MMAALALYLSLYLAASPGIESFAAATTTLTLHSFRPLRQNRHWCTFVTSPSPAASARRKYSCCRQVNANSPTRNHSRPSHLFGKNKYGGDSKSKEEIQQELFLDLETKFDYDGRISSKVKVQINDDNDDDSAPTTTSATDNPHKCALLTILGKPNMGKSTLLNALLTDELAIATSRPQTTRHAILGVLTTDHTQLCITDTPGIIASPAYKLQTGMMDTVKGAVKDADVFLVVTDVYSGIKRDKSETSENDDDDDGEFEEEESEDDPYDLGIGEDILTKLRTSQRPVIVCVNKVDLVAFEGSSVYTNTPPQAVQTIQKWRSVLPDAFAIIPTCAANGPEDAGVVALRSMLLANDPTTDVGAAVRGLGRPVPGMFTGSNNMITQQEARDVLPEGPPLYHPDFFTDRTDRFCASELIRETLFTSLGKELPYCCEVRIETFDESKRYFDEDNGTKRKSMIRIEALILVERDSQKGIVVGKGGSQIKDVGIEARKKLQEFFGVKVFLELRVKVDKNWRNNEDKLKKFGYM